MTTEISLRNLSLSISADGAPGQKGIDGRNGTADRNPYRTWYCEVSGDKGEPGSHGHAGGGGAPGGTINLGLRVDKNSGRVLAELEDRQIGLPLGNPLCKIHLSASGGKGGKGGTGGKGGAGGNGMKGEDAVLHFYGEDGKPGEKGGNGGSGGVGGNGGPGGTIKVQVDQKDMDLLTLISDWTVKGGSGGQGGCGGQGGPGGFGGAGGRRNYDMPGGRRGPLGSPGNRGTPGTNGRDGSPGHFSVEVISAEKSTSYDRPYAVALRILEVQDSNQDGIIEPGDHIKVLVEVENTGGMPTPLTRAIAIGLKPNSATLSLTQGSQLEESLKPGEKVQKQIGVKVFDSDTCAKGPGLQETLALDLSLVMERTNQVCRPGLSSPRNIEVRYPVELLPLDTESAITSGQEVPLVLRVHNLSQKAWGEAVSDRKVEMVLKSSEPLLYTTLEGKVHDLSKGFTVRAASIDAHSVYRKLGTLSLPEATQVNYSRIQLCAKLLLGSKTIQATAHPLQVSEPFESCESDGLILINSQTPKTIVEQLRNLGAERGLSKLSVWNTDLFGYPQFREVVGSTGKTLAQLFAGKPVIVCAGNDCSPRKNQVLWQDLWWACQTHGVQAVNLGSRAKTAATQVFSSSLDTEEVTEAELISTIRSSRATNKEWLVPIKQTTFAGHHLGTSAQKLRKKWKERLKNQFLTRRFAVQVSFQGESDSPLPHGFGKREFSLKVRELQRKTDRRLMQLTGSSWSPQEVGLSLLILMPFYQKLEYLIRRKAPFQELRTAILSDLMQEQMYLRDENWQGSLSSNDIALNLHYLRSLREFAPRIKDSSARELIAETLYTIWWISCQDIGAADTFLPGRRRAYLSKHTKREIKLSLEALGFDEQDRSAIRKRVGEELKKVPLETLKEQCLNPVPSLQKLGDVLGTPATPRQKRRLPEGNVLERYRFKNEEQRVAALQAFSKQA